jgi:hypothetical protein
VYQPSATRVLLWDAWPTDYDPDTHLVVADIERRLIERFFWHAAFDDGVHGTSRVDALQRVVDAEVADGRADALDEDGQVPDCAAIDDD